MQLRIQYHAHLVQIACLEGFIVIPARILHDPVQAVRHHKEFFLPVRILAGLCLTQALLCISFGVNDDTFRDDLYRTVKFKGPAFRSLDPFFQKGGFFSPGFFQNAAESSVHHGPEVAAVVSDRILAVLMVTVIQNTVAKDVIIIFIRIDRVDRCAHAVLDPELAGLQDVFLIFLIQIILVDRTRSKGIDLIQEPGKRVFREQRAAPVFHTRISDDDLMIPDRRRHLFKQVP